MEKQFPDGLGLAVILRILALNLLFVIRDLCSVFRCCIHPLLQLLYAARRSVLGLRSSNKNADPNGPDGKCIDEVKVSGAEVKLVMERLGICCDPEGDEGLKEGIGSAQIAGLFDHQEPSLEEVKEAFDVFDRNGDGFIDATELCIFLALFGLPPIAEEDCRGLIRAYDDNADGVIDLREFTKLVEKSLH